MCHCKLFEEMFWRLLTIAVFHNLGGHRAFTATIPAIIWTIQQVTDGGDGGVNPVFLDFKFYIAPSLSLNLLARSLYCAGVRTLRLILA